VDAFMKVSCETFYTFWNCCKKEYRLKKWCRLLSARDESKVPTMGIVMESEI
jgi:hypothetical protein